MLKFLVAPVLALGLSACVTAGPGPAPSPSDPTSYIADIQKAAVAACGFLPQASFVADLFLSGNSTVQTAQAWAAAICAAVTPKATVRRGGAVTPGRVNGIPVRGRFVR
jgi:hypothetical protein